MSAIMQWLIVEGVDSESFLQGQLSCDVTALDMAHWQLAAYCSPQGKVLAVIWLFRDDSRFYLGIPDDIVSALHKRMRLFVLRSQVDISVSHLVGMAYRAQDMQDVEMPSREISLTEQGTFRLQGMAGVDVVVGTIAQQRSEQVLASEYWRAARIRSGIAQIYSQTADQFLPQALGLDKAGAISFTKGCYVGQENIARLHYKSQTRRHLAVAESALQIAPMAGVALYYEGQRSAMVLDSGVDELGCVIQAVVPARMIGLPLQIDGNEEVLYFKHCYESE